MFTSVPVSGKCSNQQCPKCEITHFSRYAVWSVFSSTSVARQCAPVVMVLIVVPTAMAVVTVAKSVADNLAHILLELATIPIVVVVTMTPAI